MAAAAAAGAPEALPADVEVRRRFAGADEEEGAAADVLAAGAAAAAAAGAFARGVLLAMLESTRARGTLGDGCWKSGGREAQRDGARGAEDRGKESGCDGGEMRGARCKRQAGKKQQAHHGARDAEQTAATAARL